MVLCTFGPRRNGRLESGRKNLPLTMAVGASCFAALLRFSTNHVDV